MKVITHNGISTYVFPDDSDINLRCDRIINDKFTIGDIKSYNTLY